MKDAATVLSLVLLAGLCAAQPMSLMTTFAGGNGQSGNMFDLEATGGVDVIVVGFDIHVGTTTTQAVEVWTKTGTHVGHETTMASWTMLANYPSVTCMGAGTPTPLPQTLSVTIPAGQRQAFYVTMVTSTDIDYTNGSSVGSSFASDAFLTFYEGVGNSYPFGGTFSPRVWNGNIYYTSGCRGECVNPYVPMLNVMGTMPTQSAQATEMIDTTMCGTDNETPSCGTGGEDAVARFSAPFDGEAFITTCNPGTSFDTILSVLDGPCGSLELNCNDDFACAMGTGTESTLAFPVTSGAEYTVVVDGSGGATGMAELDIEIYEPATCSAVGPVGVVMGDLTIDVDVAVATAMADLTLEFTTDAGMTFTPCTAAAASAITNPAVVPGGIATFVWDSSADGVGTPMQANGVFVRANVTGIGVIISSCDTAPFDVMNALCSGFCGDCDLSGAGADVLDALVAAQIAAAIVAASPMQEGCCDVNGSMSVEVLDALLIAQEAAGLMPTLMCP